MELVVEIARGQCEKIRSGSEIGYRGVMTLKAKNVYAINNKMM